MALFVSVHRPTRVRARLAMLECARVFDLYAGQGSAETAAI